MPVLLASWASPVMAQVSDGALAEELFQQGKALMVEERYGEACPKLAESQRLDPSTGTLLNLAVCHEKQGKLATAWNEYNEALVAARQDAREDRVAYARERIAAIEPKLSRLTISLPEEHDVRGLEVQVDGVKVGRPALGVALPIDPGAHTVVVSAPGKKPWQANIDIAEGPATKSLSIPRLLDAPAEPASTGGSGAAAHVQDTTRGSTQRYLAYGLGGLGLVGVGLGSFWGLDAKGKFDESNERGCDGNECTPDGADLRNSARDAGTLSTVAFAAGAAALGAGVILYLTAPAEPADSNSASALKRDGGWQARFRGTADGAAAELVTTW